MNARLDGGWIVVPYAGAPTAQCLIATGARSPGQWRPAYRDWRGSERVLQVRPPAGSGAVKVWVKINGQVTAAGSVRL